MRRSAWSSRNFKVKGYKCDLTRRQRPSRSERPGAVEKITVIYLAEGGEEKIGLESCYCPTRKGMLVAQAGPAEDSWAERGLKRARLSEWVQLLLFSLSHSVSALHMSAFEFSRDTTRHALGTGTSGPHSRRMQIHRMCTAKTKVQLEGS